MSLLSRAFALWYLCLQAKAAQVFVSPSELPTTIPATCRAALSTNITCNTLILASDIAGTTQFYDIDLESACSSGCTNSLAVGEVLYTDQSFQSSVNSRCGNTAYNNNGTTLYGWAIADPLVWASKVACLKDERGFCLPRMANGTLAPCSDCYLKYQAAMLGSSYGAQRVQPDSFTSALSSCSKPASSYPYTTSSMRSTIPPTTTTVMPQPTCVGSRYTVASSDTCESISQAKKVATDRLIAMNGLDYNCTSLRAGNTLCVDGFCKLRKIVAGDTCAKLIEGQTFYIDIFLSWNPTLTSICNNLDPAIGRNICMSPPGYLDWDAGPTSRTTPTVTFTMFNGSLVPGPTTRGTYTTMPTILRWPTEVPPLPTATYNANATNYQQWEQWRKWCPITSEDVENGWWYDQLAPACEALLEPYCEPDLNKPSPTSKRFPTMCTPASVRAAEQTSTAT